MKKIGFIGAYDKKMDFLIYVAKLLKRLDYNVMIIDASTVQKAKYTVPSINPTKSYITEFDEIDFAIGFKSLVEIERYTGINFQSESEESSYDYVLIDVDSEEGIQEFEIENASINFLTTSFDTYSLKRGLSSLQGLKTQIELTRILFSYENTKDEEEVLDYLSMDYKIKWSDYIIYSPIIAEDCKVIQENERLERIAFRRLSSSYRDAVAYVIQIADPTSNIGKLKKAMKD